MNGQLDYRRANDSLRPSPDLIRKTAEQMEGKAIPRRRKRQVWSLTAAAAAVLALIFLLQLWPRWEKDPGGDNPYAVTGVRTLAAAVLPDYPTIPLEQDYADGDAYFEDYDAYRQTVREIRGEQAEETYLINLSSFSSQLLRLLLAGEGENRVVSPANLYLALAALTEVTAGESQQQILSLLGAEDVETVRTQTERIWRNLYMDDGYSTSILNTSLWLREGEDYNQNTLQSLAEHYFASIYEGETGTAAFDQAMQAWLNQATGGLLEDAVSGLETESYTVMVLLSTLYYKAAWADPFDPQKVEPGIFTAADGRELETEYLHRTIEGTIFYEGNGFSAASLPLKEGAMTFLLPEEGTAPEALLENSTAMDLILHGLYSLEGAQYGDVIYTIPKFDISSNVDLMEPLAQLGLTQIQDPSAADFSPLRQEPSFLTNASTAARVRIDETGAEGTSYVMLATGSSSDAPDENPPVCVLELDRPFLFLISGTDSLPRFVGVVNQP